MNATALAPQWQLLRSAKSGHPLGTDEQTFRVPSPLPMTSKATEAHDRSSPCQSRSKHISNSDREIVARLGAKLISLFGTISPGDGRPDPHLTRARR